MENTPTPYDAIWGLVTMLGEIQNEMRRGDAEPVTEQEIDDMYDMASIVLQHFEK